MSNTHLQQHDMLDSNRSDDILTGIGSWIEEETGLMQIALHVPDVLENLEVPAHIPRGPYTALLACNGEWNLNAAVPSTS